MKLSERSIQILRNFSSINPSIQFEAGTNLRTISPNKTIMAVAKLDTTIESTFSIYDLSRFLGIMSLLKEPEFELGDKQLRITSNDKVLNYTYADVNTIVTPPNRDIKLNGVDVEFTLNQEQYVDIMKAIGVLSLPDFVVSGESGKIVLRATNTKNPVSDTYDIVVGETDKEFTAIFKAENIKIISDTYTVKLSSQGIAHFSSDDVEYWIPLESNSEF